MTLGVRASCKADVGELSVVLARAFHDDPVMVWMLPNVVRRARALPRMFATMTRHHFLPGGGAEVAGRDDAIGGATLWDPPGRWKTPQKEEWLMKPAFVTAFRSRIPAAQKVADVMKEHHPEEPHWYLMVIGTDPSVRGKGFGEALMHSRLDRCDAEHAPAYLEASKPELVPYYRRFGFEVTGEIKLPDGGPSMWPMWRAPVL
jgi:ribosomal protein S18 acetylase RimI-like enzyme